MSLFDSASLVVTPNGVKEGKLYSIKPTDGSGDLSVTRATTATRVNSSGLVEVVPRNLFTYSEQFNDSSWIKGGGNGASVPTVTSNTIIAPNGTLTADTVVFPSVSSTAFSLIYKLPLVVGNYTTSIYLKGATGGEVIWMSWTSDGVNYLRKSLSITADWQRFDFPANISSSFSGIQFGIDLRDNQQSAKPSQTIYFWGAQLEQGATATDYYPTTTRLNIPRLDYTNGSCPSILVEPQRTNLALYSNDFNNAVWVKVGNNGGNLPIVTSNYATSPDGTNNATRIQLSRNTNVNSISFLGQVINTSSLQRYASVWIKSLSGTPKISLGYNGVNFNTNITLTTNWKKYEIDFGILTYAEIGFLIGGTDFGTGLSTSADILVYGFQFEVGSYATSYIPTTSASVTRNADVISKTGISSFIGQTEGTVFCDVYRKNSNSEFLLMVANSIGTNAYLNSIYFYQTSASVLIAEVFVSGTLQARITTSSGLSVGKHKIALGYKQNDFILYVDGVEIGTDTSGNIPTLSTLEINGADSGFTSSVGINSVVLWKEKLSNDTLATLTTL